MVNWFNQKNQSLTLPEADCIDVRANVIPEKFKLLVKNQLGQRLRIVKIIFLAHLNI